MRIRFFLLSGLLSFGVMAAVEAADKPNTCKSDTRAIEPCRWIKGQLGMSMRGVIYLSPEGDERSFAIEDGTLDYDIVCSSSAGIRGEFEFCRFADRDVPENRPDILQNGQFVEFWGCISALKNLSTIAKPFRNCPPLSAKP